MVNVTRGNAEGRSSKNAVSALVVGGTLSIKDIKTTEGERMNKRTDISDLKVLQDASVKIAERAESLYALQNATQAIARYVVDVRVSTPEYFRQEEAYRW